MALSLIFTKCKHVSCVISACQLSGNKIHHLHPCNYF